MLKYNKNGKYELLPTSNSSLKTQRPRAIAKLATIGSLVILSVVLYFFVTGIESRSLPLKTDSVKVQELVAEKNEPLVKEEQPLAASSAHTLVIYVFANTDPEYEENLQHFVREGIHENDGCTYIIAIQLGADLPVIALLPTLPSNARYVYHKNECFDSGTVGWVLETQVKDVRSFKYVVWLNGSQRGPFLPAYVKRRMHWTEALTDRITGRVKLVGATIHCGVTYNVPAVPHVQSYLMATDQIGLEIIQRDSKALKCWDTLRDTVIHSELGASAAIFLAGYSIDCLMLRYQGVNWRSLDALDCNAGLNPLPQSFNDGINLDPLEVLFVKVKTGLRSANWTYVQQAVKYDKWSQHERGLTASDLGSNAWQTDVRPQIVTEAHKMGAQCFDDGFYVSFDPTELGFILHAENRKVTAFQHFIDVGISEGRPYRYTC